MAADKDTAPAADTWAAVDIAVLVPNQAAAGMVVVVDRKCAARVARVRSVVAALVAVGCTAVDTRSSLFLSRA